MTEKGLAGQRVVVTRPARQARGMMERLRALGAEPIAFPTIRIADAADPGPLLEAARRAGEFEWVVFTSVNGVSRFWEALEAVGRGGAAVRHARFACIGPATADALAERGYRAELVPRRYVAEGVAEELVGRGDVAGARILLPRAAGARDVLPERLAAAGADVLEVEAYRAVADAPGAAALRGRLDRGEVDVVTFTSSSTVRHFVDAVGTALGDARVAAIGPITAGTAREAGLPVHVVAERHTVDGLLDALVAATA